MRSYLIFVTALLAFGLVTDALDPVIVKHLVQMGTECVDIGETCASCTSEEGDEVFVRCEGAAMPATFCDFYGNDQCAEYDEVGWAGPYWAPCDLVPQCHASIAFDPEILFEGRLSTSNGTFFFHRANDMNGAAIVSSTSASARGYLPNVGFASDTDTVRYVGVDQMAGTATTTAGDCELGAWCAAGETLEYRVTVVTNTTATSPQGGGFESPTSPLVDIYSDIPMTLHTNVAQQFFFRQEEVLIALSSLGEIAFTMPCGSVFYGDDNEGLHRCKLSNFALGAEPHELTFDVSMDDGEAEGTSVDCYVDVNPSISNVPVFDCSNRLLSRYFD